MVPGTGLEPARHKAYAPKAYVYTNFTTRAYLDCNGNTVFLQVLYPVAVSLFVIKIESTIIITGLCSKYPICDT